MVRASELTSSFASAPTYPIESHICVQISTSQATYWYPHALPPGRNSMTMPETAQPSTANIAIACAIIGGVTGYLIGQAKSLGLFGGSPISVPKERKEKAESEDDSEESSDEDDEVPSEFPGHTEECKLVLIVRTDLGMTKGMLGQHLTVAGRHSNNEQARLVLSAAMRRSRATSNSFDDLPNPRYYDDGSAADR